jgi:thiosulfate dehydrogenase
MRLALILVVLSAGCRTETALQRGSELFNDPNAANIPSNVFSCGTCHSVLPDGDPNRINAGYSLANTLNRPSWWGGAYDDPLDAVNECWVEFMRAEKGFAPDDPDGRAILIYLQSISTAPAPALPLTIVKNIITDPMLPGWVPEGDATRGAATYQKACAQCHGAINSGDGRLGPSVSVIPKETIANHGTDMLMGARPVTIEKIRHGKFFTIGGNMAPYSLETLSDSDVGDILAYMSL